MAARTAIAGTDMVPPPPWELTGEALVALRIVPQAVARALVPADVPIFCSRCRRTVALLYVARYSNTPVGEYSELIVAPAIVRQQRGLAFWISHIVVDSEASAAAGRQIWALPKLLGSFDWQPGARRVELASEQVSLRCEARAPRWQLRAPFGGAARSRFELLSRTFAVRASGYVGLVRATIELSGAPQLRALGFERSRTMCRVQDMNVAIAAPKPCN
jgi:Acetoacetate decarboxylase (ADC)